MMISFRAIREEDICEVCALPQSKEELFFLSPKSSFPLTKKSFTKIISNRHSPTVVLKNDRVVGFASLYKVEEKRSCFIGNVIISPQARGAGIGRALVEKMTSISVEKYGAQEVHLSCFNDNLSGLLLYSKMGFKPYKIEERSDFKDERVALIHLKRKTT